MKPVFLILESQNIHEEALAVYRRLGDVEFFQPESGRDHSLATVLVVRLGYRLDEPFLQRFPHLRLLVSPTTGLNHVDLEACRARGITVLSLKGETEFLQSITATADLAFALLLALVRRIHAGVHSVVRDGLWDRDRFRGRELQSMVLGLVGFGRLGRIMARYASAFGMRVLACDPFIDPRVFPDHAVTPCDLESLFRQSDAVSLHADYRQENEKMITRAHFCLLPFGSYFINTARGELVDETALLEALETGRLAGAAVDVLDHELEGGPLLDRPLVRYARSHDHVLITPHLGGCTFESMHKTELFMARRVEAWLQQGETS